MYGEKRASDPAVLFSPCPAPFLFSGDPWARSPKVVVLGLNPKVGGSHLGDCRTLDEYFRYLRSKEYEELPKFHRPYVKLLRGALGLDLPESHAARWVRENLVHGDLLPYFSRSWRVTRVRLLGSGLPWIQAHFRELRGLFHDAEMAIQLLILNGKPWTHLVDAADDPLGIGFRQETALLAQKLTGQSDRHVRLGSCSYLAERVPTLVIEHFLQRLPISDESLADLGERIGARMRRAAE